MKILGLFVLQVFCDNIEIAISDFTEMDVNGTVIRSSEITNGNSIKISHPGNSIYRLVETSPKVFKMIDKAVYFNKNTPAPVCIDVEKKILGLCGFVWKFLIFNAVLSISLGFILPKYLRKALFD